MFRSFLKSVGMLAMVLAFSFGVLATSPANVALAAGQPAQAAPHTIQASANLPVISDPTGQGVCLPSGYNLNGWRCGWRLYGYGGYGYGGYGNGGYYAPTYEGAYEPQYCAPDGDWDVDDWTCSGYGGYAAPMYSPGYYAPYYYSPFFYSRPFFFRRFRDIR